MGIEKQHFSCVQEKRKRKISQKFWIVLFFPQIGWKFWLQNWKLFMILSDWKSKTWKWDSGVEISENVKWCQNPKWWYSQSIQYYICCLCYLEAILLSLLIISCGVIEKFWVLVVIMVVVVVVGGVVSMAFIGWKMRESKQFPKPLFTAVFVFCFQILWVK